MRCLPRTERTASMQIITADIGYHNAEIWLNGGNVSHRAVCAYVSTMLDKSVDGWVELCELTEDDQPFMRNGAVMTHIEYGCVSWNWGKTV